jgi:hypothetical protein
MVSIKIAPALEVSKRTDHSIYDYEHQIGTAISIEKLQALLNGINNYILPAIIANEDKNISVSIKGTSLVSIGTGKKETGEIRPYIAFHKDIDADSFKSATSIYYEFKGTQIILDYDVKSGKYTCAQDNFSEFNLFINFLEASIKGLTNVNGHSVKHSDDWYRSLIRKLVSALAEKNGISTGNDYKKKPAFGNKGNRLESNEPSYDAVSEPLETMEDLNNFMQ